MKGKAVLWAGLVLTCSSLCYLPMLLEQRGVPVWKWATAARYLFVLVPLMVSLVFVHKDGGIRGWIRSGFSGGGIVQAIAFCLAVGGAGLSFSYGYSQLRDPALFSAYPTIPSVLSACAYLLATALAEELAWRGFLLRRLCAARGMGAALIGTGILWTVWHVPMWAVRNGMGVREILLYAVWTLLASFLLGIHFRAYRNIGITALLHMLLNMCFPAPMAYQIPLLAVLLAVLSFLVRKRLVSCSGSW